jgi:hypothetical protein
MCLTLAHSKSSPRSIDRSIDRSQIIDDITIQHVQFLNDPKLQDESWIYAASTIKNNKLQVSALLHHCFFPSYTLFATAIATSTSTTATSIVASTNHDHHLHHHYHLHHHRRHHHHHHHHHQPRSPPPSPSQPTTTTTSITTTTTTTVVFQEHMPNHTLTLDITA